MQIGWVSSSKGQQQVDSKNKLTLLYRTNGFCRFLVRDLLCLSHLYPELSELSISIAHVHAECSDDSTVIEVG